MKDKVMQKLRLDKNSDHFAPQLTMEEIAEIPIAERKTIFGKELKPLEEYIKNGEPLPQKNTIRINQGAQVYINGQRLNGKLFLTKEEEKYVRWMVTNRKQHDAEMIDGNMGEWKDLDKYHVD